MPEPRITKESDPDRWEAFRRQWEQEHRPGFLVLANKTYRVLKLAGNVLEFEPISAESLYESTGL